MGTRDATGDETADSKHHGTLNTKHVADTEFPDTHTLHAYGRGDHLVGQRLGAWRHRFCGRRPCPVGLQHAPHRGCHQLAGLSSIYTTYAHVSLRGIGLPSCVIFAWTSCILL